MDKAQGFILKQDGSTEAIHKLSTIFGARFLKRVGDWLVLCGADPVKTQGEQRMVDAFIRMLVDDNVGCYHFPVFVYLGSSSLHLNKR